MHNKNYIFIDYAISLFQKFLNKYHLPNKRLNTFTVVRKYTLSEYKECIKQFTLHRIDNKNLTYDDKKLILLLLGACLYKENGLGIFEVANFIHHIPSKSFEFIKEIIESKNNMLKKNVFIILDLDNYLEHNLNSLMNYYSNKKIYLSPEVIAEILDDLIINRKNENITYEDSKKYSYVNTLLNDIKRIIKYTLLLSKLHKEIVDSNIKFYEDDIYNNSYLSEMLETFKNKVLSLKKNINLKRIIKKYNLSNIEFIILLYLIYLVVIKKDYRIDGVNELIHYFSIMPTDTKRILELFYKDNVYYKENLIISDEMGNYFFYFPAFKYERDYDYIEDYIDNIDDETRFDNPPIEFYRFELVVENIINLLYDKIKKKNIQKKVDKKVENEKYISNKGRKSSDIYEIIVPKVNLSKVILDEEVKKELLDAVNLTKSINTLKEWGIKPNLATDNISSIKILLYGPSGTGKTITAQALAGEANADLFKVDASNLVSSFVGESSKNVKRVFKEFYKYAENYDKKIFLFMNEADQLLGARGAIVQAADKEYNQMQNILLEELENFEGVFIATTNLPDLFDSAWNRRFNIKIKLDIPSYETRLKLWQVHISNKLPLGEDVNIHKLAEYELAGGSIANVVYNAARKAALREKSKRFVTQKDFIDAINHEIKNITGIKNSKVGFKQ